jgi:hypothetical protein
MKTYEGVKVLLILVLDGCEWSASSPDLFTPGERSPGKYWIGGWLAMKQVWTLWSTEISRPSSP